MAPHCNPMMSGSACPLHRRPCKTIVLSKSPTISYSHSHSHIMSALHRRALCYGPHGVMSAEALPDKGPGPSLLLRCVHSLYEACCDIARAATLFIIFAPLLVTMPFALQLGWHRDRWMQLLRYALLLIHLVHIQLAWELGMRNLAELCTMLCSIISTVFVL